MVFPAGRRGSKTPRPSPIDGAPPLFPLLASLFPCCYSAVILAVPPLFFNGKIDGKCNKDSGFGG
jgi:hypothetical protein